MTIRELIEALSEIETDLGDIDVRIYHHARRVGQPGAMAEIDRVYALPSSADDSPFVLITTP